MTDGGCEQGRKHKIRSAQWLEPTSSRVREDSEGGEGRGEGAGSRLGSRKGRSLSWERGGSRRKQAESGDAGGKWNADVEKRDVSGTGDA